MKKYEKRIISWDVLCEETVKKLINIRDPTSNVIGLSRELNKRNSQNKSIEEKLNEKILKINQRKEILGKKRIKLCLYLDSLNLKNMS